MDVDDFVQFVEALVNLSPEDREKMLEAISWAKKDYKISPCQLKGREVLGLFTRWAYNLSEGDINYIDPAERD